MPCLGSFSRISQASKEIRFSRLGGLVDSACCSQLYLSGRGLNMSQDDFLQCFAMHCFLIAPDNAWWNYYCDWKNSRTSWSVYQYVYVFSTVFLYTTITRGISRKNDEPSMVPKRVFSLMTFLKDLNSCWPRYVLSGDGLRPPSGSSDCNSYVWSRIDAGGAAGKVTRVKCESPWLKVYCFLEKHPEAIR